MYTYMYIVDIHVRIVFSTLIIKRIIRTSTCTCTTVYVD